MMRLVLFGGIGATVLAMVLSACPPSSSASSSASASAAPSGVAQVSPVGAELPPGPDRELVIGRCLACHDERYLAQQRLSAAQWEKVVVKMQGFGAPVYEGDAARMAIYLARAFPADQADRVPPLVDKPTL